ncbi:putative Squamosa promoter-binding-like protein 10 [Hibiscus syriacus]|uniref:Squamosa promoter-binding-like protein 10 n=1 Tax=Hibiscus syriacus TaxID=106335 RepID=A0A6A3A045_HIBSY|nr:metalloendoproteinase 4-MMP-like [Hibiscus syriacus]KAE8697518.1 putative Squamosa promoter-binding-like protein 10 [Hibiscus syriacus]
MLLPSTHPLPLLFIFFLHNLRPFTAARPVSEFPFKKLTVSTVSNYYKFKYFGYLTSPDYNISDVIFDAHLEPAIKHYHATKKYVYFPGKPRWARSIPMTLTYGFSPDNLIHYLSSSDIRKTFKRAFSRWASVIPVSFVEADDYGSADIKIGFYVGDHGDGEPFDGVLGILAHSFSPESGKLHLDAAETWAVDFGVEQSDVAVDLESVALHEIGHLLGLAHSPVKSAVMYPSLKPREKKVDLSMDDIQGVQSLYGSNPNFTFGSLMESDTSANQAIGLRFEPSFWATSMFLAAAFFSV